MSVAKHQTYFKDKPYGASRVANDDIRQKRTRKQCEIDHRPYKEYLKLNKPITNHLASIKAIPKMTKGDSHRHRRILQNLKSKGLVELHTVPIRGKSYNVSELKRNME
jgi:hypothetical protein